MLGMKPGDLLVCTRTTIDGCVVVGSVVTVDQVRGEYVTLDETGPALSYLADRFVLAVRRPWWAWADEEGWRRAGRAEALALVASFPRPVSPETPADDRDCGCDEGGLCERHRVEGHTCGEAGGYCDDEVHRALRCECGSAAWVAMDDPDATALTLTCARCGRDAKHPRASPPICARCEEYVDVTRGGYFECAVCFDKRSGHTPAAPEMPATEGET